MGDENITPSCTHQGEEEVQHGVQFIFLMVEAQSN
jgi:hypothetical protein